jgi:hypothetical protein
MRVLTVAGPRGQMDVSIYRISYRYPGLDNKRIHSWQLVREVTFKETVLLGFNVDPDPAFQLICIRIHTFDDQKL